MRIPLKSIIATDLSESEVDFQRLSVERVRSEDVWAGVEHLNSAYPLSWRGDILEMAIINGINEFDISLSF